MKLYGFPGQGSQFPGMGKDLYESNALAKELFDKADAILGFSLTDIMFNGSAEDLLQTRVGMLETRNWLQIMQDIEFTVINDWIQNTRNRLGNAAASGNGQFIRVSSVSVQRPWGNALLEDLALCQILLMLVKEFYMILIKALNRTCLFGAFFEADGILFQSNSLQKVSEIRIAIGCAFNLLDFTINAL